MASRIFAKADCAVADVKGPTATSAARSAEASPGENRMEGSSARAGVDAVAAARATVHGQRQSGRAQGEHIPFHGPGADPEFLGQPFAGGGLGRADPEVLDQGMLAFDQRQHLMQLRGRPRIAHVRSFD